MSNTSKRRKAELIEKYPILKTLEIGDLEWEQIEMEDKHNDVVHYHYIRLEKLARLTKSQLELLIRLPTLACRYDDDLEEFPPDWEKGFGNEFQWNISDKKKRQTELIEKYPALKTLELSDHDWEIINNEDLDGERITVYYADLEKFTQLTKRQQEIAKYFPTVGCGINMGMREFRQSTWDNLEKIMRRQETEEKTSKQIKGE